MIRAYIKEDKVKLVELLRLNTPVFFAVEEKTCFVDYLDNEIESYFVFELNNEVIGAGGINYGFDGGKTVRISWDMVHPEHHRNGIGPKLTQYRIQEIKKNPQIETIIVRTTQLVYKFYEKMGFELEKKKLNFWAEGIDLYQMKIVIKSN